MVLLSAMAPSWRPLFTYCALDRDLYYWHMWHIFHMFLYLFRSLLVSFCTQNARLNLVMWLFLHVKLKINSCCTLVIFICYTLCVFWHPPSRKRMSVPEYRPCKGYIASQCRQTLPFVVFTRTCMLRPRVYTTSNMDSILLE